MAVHPRGVVEGRDIETTWRRRPVFPTLAAARLLLARRSVPHEHELPFALHFVPLLRFVRQAWKPPVGRVDDERRPRPRRLHRCKDSVVGPGHILRRPAWAALEAPPSGHVEPYACLIRFGPLFSGRKLSVTKLARPFEWRGIDIEPNALEVRMPPRRRIRSLAPHPRRGELQHDHECCEHHYYTDRLQ